MLNYDTLYKGHWVSLITPAGKTGYEILHELNGVIVMPLIITPTDVYTVIRKEFCPPYMMKTPEYQHYYTVISGTQDGHDDNEDPFACMLRELQEEAGIEPIKYDVLWKTENMPMYKGSDRRSWNYILNIHSFRLHKPEPDGTIGEAFSKSIPIRVSELKSIITQPNCDFLLYSMSSILLEIIRQQIAVPLDFHE